MAYFSIVSFLLDSISFNYFMIRNKRALKDPVTPDVHQRCSRRSWDGQIKKWRKLLHQYDLKQGDLATESEAHASISPVTLTEQAAVERDLMQSILGQEFDEDKENGDGGSDDGFKRELAALLSPHGKQSHHGSTQALHSTAVHVSVGVDDDFLEAFFDQS